MRLYHGAIKTLIRAQLRLYYGAIKGSRRFLVLQRTVRRVLLPLSARMRWACPLIGPYLQDKVLEFVLLSAASLSLGSMCVSSY